MKITLYNNTSEVNAINKNLFYIGDLVGDLKQATSLLNPSILIEMNNGELIYDVDVVDENNDELMYLDDTEEIDISVNINYTIFDANYCYIHEFKRYYFIDNIIIQNNKLFMLQLNVDVLESYKEQFMSLNAFITRNEFTYDNYVKDDLLTYYYDKEVNEFVADKGDKVNCTFTTALPSDEDLQHNITISCFNDDISHPGSTTGISGTTLPVVNTDVTGFSSTTNDYVMNNYNLVELSKWAIYHEILMDYINSVIIYPFQVPIDEYTEKHTLKLGSSKLKPSLIGDLSHGLQEIEVYNVKGAVSPYLVIADFVINGSSFLDYEPFKQYEIYLPYLSWIQVKADDILNNRIIVYYVVDYATGNAQATIYDVTNNKLIYTSSTQLGVKVGFTKTNYDEIQLQRANNNTSLAMNLMSGFLGLIGSATTGNVGGALKGGGSMLSSFLQKDIADSSLIVRASGQVSSGQNGLYLPQDVKIRITSMKPKNYNNDYAKLYGRPLNEYKKLNEVTGYTIISDIHLENVNATQTELTSIENSLKNGVIIK